MARFSARVALALGAFLLTGCLRLSGRPAAPAGVRVETWKQDARRVEKQRRRLAAETKRLYEAGVDAYARGDLGEAERLFTAVLRLDPGHRSAQKALRRLAQPEQ